MNLFRSNTVKDMVEQKLRLSAELSPLSIKLTDRVTGRPLLEPQARRTLTRRCFFGH